jgi:hypothetical protein
VIDIWVLDILYRKGVSKDGKPLVDDNGMLRVQMVDWDKSNLIIKQEMIKMLFLGSEVLNGKETDTTGVAHYFNIAYKF